MYDELAIRALARLSRAGARTRNETVESFNALPRMVPKARIAEIVDAVFAEDHDTNFAMALAAAQAVAPYAEELGDRTADVLFSELGRPYTG